MDPLSSLSKSGMLNRALGVQKPSPGDQLCPLASTSCQLQPWKWAAVPGGCMFAHWDHSTRTPELAFLPSLCCRISSSQCQHRGDPCHEEARGNSPKTECKNLKQQNKSGRQLRSVPACLTQWVSVVQWLLSINKELGPRLKVKAHHRILLQGGGNQPWQYE